MATSRSDQAGAVRRLLVVEHDQDAPAGLLSGWAAGLGLTVRTVRLHTGDRLPREMGSGTAAVVLGSEHTAYDDSVPWLRAELAFVERLLAGPVPVLGICFGGQVLARVLGARVYRLAEPEIGWVQVRSQCPAIAGGPWLSWHRDAFTLPDGATELAVNEVSVQAFRLGPHAGIQFHPEATQPIAAGWLGDVTPAPDRRLTGPLFTAAEDRWRRAAANAVTLFSAWLNGGMSSG